MLELQEPRYSRPETHRSGKERIGVAGIPVVELEPVVVEEEVQRARGRGRAPPDVDFGHRIDAEVFETLEAVRVGENQEADVGCRKGEELVAKQDFLTRPAGRMGSFTLPKSPVAGIDVDDHHVTRNLLLDLPTALLRFRMEVHVFGTEGTLAVVLKLPLAFNLAADMLDGHPNLLVAVFESHEALVEGYFQKGNPNEVVGKRVARSLLDIVLVGDRISEVDASQNLKQCGKGLNPTFRLEVSLVLRTVAVVHVLGAEEAPIKFGEFFLVGSPVGTLEEFGEGSLAGVAFGNAGMVHVVEAAQLIARWLFSCHGFVKASQDRCTISCL